MLGVNLRVRHILIFGLFLLFTGYSVYSLRFVQEVPFSIFWTRYGNIVIAGETSDRKVILYRENTLYTASIKGIDYQIRFNSGYLMYREAGKLEWSRWMPQKLPVFRIEYSKSAPFNVKWISPGFIEVGGASAERKILLYKENAFYDFFYQGLGYQITFYKGCFFYRPMNTMRWNRWLPDDLLALWVARKLGEQELISKNFRIYLDEYTDEIVIEKNVFEDEHPELYRLSVHDTGLEEKVIALKPELLKYCGL